MIVHYNQLKVEAVGREQKKKKTQAEFGTTGN